ncbi:MAG: LCP family protein [Clostridia bacterium]|jgi:LCP family protein required for cell wall assembly
MKKFFKIAGVVILALVIVVASAVFFFLNSLGPEQPEDVAEDPEFQMPEPPEKDERVNVLVMGTDLGDPTDSRAPSRTDTMILASFDPKEKKLDLISLPRDTRVEIKGKGLDKLGHAHAYGGVGLAMDTVSNFLDIDVHYYFKIDYAGFRKFIDNLGGVRVNVPFDMNYYDPYDNPPLRINLKKGWQTLNGEKALQYVRNREGYPNGDIGRIQAQQALIDAVIDKVLSAGTILRLPALADTLSSHLSTNMTPSEMSKYAFRAAGINKESINMYRIPGDAKYINGISYFLHDEKKTRELISMVLGKPDSEDGMVKVEVLNGSGVTGLAAKVGDMLKDKGCDVIKVGNAEGTEYSSTYIYDRKGNGEKAKRIAEILDVNEYKVELDDKTNADVTVILGKDKSNL